MRNKRFIHKIKNGCDKPTTFIILCGRKSSKRGYKNIPLTPINEVETLIGKQIKIIKDNYEHDEIIIISGFEHDKVVSHISGLGYKDVRIAENKDYKESNVLDGWRFALNIAIVKDTYIIHGDRLFDESYLKEKSRATHTFVHDFDKNNYDLGLLYENDNFINMSYGLPNVWSEIIFISQDDFDIFKQIVNECKNRKIYNIENYLNTVSKTINISVIQKPHQDIRVLKEL